MSKDKTPAPDTKPKRITANDVARLAGVSKAAVSLVLSGHRGARIAEATRQRIRKAVDELGYVPSRLGKGFLQGQSRIVGVVMHFSQLVPWLDGFAAIQEELAQAGYVPITLTPSLRAIKEDERGNGIQIISDEKVNLRRLLEYQIDGLLYLTLNPKQAAVTLDDIARHQIPTVIMGSRLPGMSNDFVATDEAKVGQMAARHLMSLGTTSFGVVDHTSPFPAVVRRCKAFIAEVEKAGHKCHVFKSYPTDRDGYARWLPEWVRPPAGVFAVNDVYAAMAVKTAAALGWRVPEEVAVVGMGGYFQPQHSHIPLTSINRHCDLVGRQAVQFLLERIQGYQGPPRSLLVPPSLEINESTRKQ